MANDDVKIALTIVDDAEAPLLVVCGLVSEEDGSKTLRVRAEGFSADDEGVVELATMLEGIAQQARSAMGNRPTRPRFNPQPRGARQ